MTLSFYTKMHTFMIHSKPHLHSRVVDVIDVDAILCSDSHDP